MLMLISRLFHAGSHTIILMLMFMLVLIAQVGTRLDCEQSLFCSKIRGKKEAEHESRASSEAASSARGGRRAKRETAMVSYNDCEARHSGDGVILLVDDDAQLSAIFISDMRGEFEPYFAVLEIKESA